MRAGKQTTTSWWPPSCSSPARSTDRKAYTTAVREGPARSCPNRIARPFRRAAASRRSRRRGAVGREDLLQRHARAAAGGPRDPPRRVRHAARPLGLRQEHAAQDGGGPARAHATGACCWWREPVDAVGEPAARLAFVFQTPTLMPWARVQTNVRLPLDLAGVPRERGRRARRARRWRWSASTGSRATCRAQLSGGMQMRVSIARGAGDEPEPAADGRALRRARRDHAPPARRRPARAVGARRSSP